MLVLIQITRQYCQKNLMKLEFSRHILESTQTSNFTEIGPVGTQLFHGNGQTDGRKHMTKEFCECA
jgi:hypothetical protein